ncbi:Lytic transglycosylase, catalytic (modular protein) [Candidatus Terasakiella magnetica]|uniref:Lytic transglycosylase, catalytic (Modular protein) n=1 Tax=Candidatus Terasakiella magnetica TaxID=1867952 RepID=A0A1C3RME0_9PROT|nr:lytic transglycosylase domain-containing protein [Candidatus Terasakiella magnetica]SCA58269.1 Lytic transglycosylase, catalytic (modular protein) [Candidatus Terasakiella magnetica]
MRRLLTLFWLIGLFMAAAFVANVEAATRFEIKQMVIEEAAQSEVPIALALAVAKVESDFNAKALSSAGARGVMQIMPKTAHEEFGVKAQRLWNPEINIRLGVEFLEQLHEQYDGRWELALSHYNGGTVKGNKPHKYTRKYIHKVQKWQRVYQEQASLWEGRLEDDDRFDVAELREWRPRGGRYNREPLDDFEEVSYEEDWNDTRIIIVERRPSSRWERPPPRPFYGRTHDRRRPVRHFH